MVNTGGSQSAVDFAEVTIELQMFDKKGSSPMTMKTQQGMAAAHGGDKKSLLFKALKRALAKLAVEFSGSYPIEGYITETRGNREFAKINIGSDFGIKQNDVVEIIRNGSAVSSGRCVNNMVFPGYAWVHCDVSTKQDVLQGAKIVFKHRSVASKDDRSSIIREDLATADLQVVPLRKEEQIMVKLDNPDSDFQVKLWVNKKDSPVYYPGDTLVVYFQAAEDCYIKLVSLQTDGSILQLFPNEYQENNFCKANQVYSVPDNSYSMSISPPGGIQRIKAIASRTKLQVADASSHGFADIGSKGLQEVYSKNISISKKKNTRSSKDDVWATASCEFEIRAQK